MKAEERIDAVGGASKPRPFALKDAPVLTEVVFPVQKISFEAQRERKANLGLIA